MAAERTAGTKPKHSHSGQGQLASTLVLFILSMALVLGSFWAFATYPESWEIWVVGLVVYALSLLLPVALISSRTAKRAPGGKELVMDIPPTSEVLEHQAAVRAQH